MLQTTAERRCALTRVRPSGLNATSLTGLVSAVSGEPYGTPVFASHTKTEPVERRSGQQPSVRTEVERVGGLVADRQRPADRSARCDVDHGHRAGLVARDQRPAAVGEDRLLDVLAPDRERLPDPAPVATSQIPTVPGAPGTAIRFESGLKAIECAPPDSGGFVSIGAADHATARGIPEGDVVVLQPAGRDHGAVGAVPDRGERPRRAGLASSRSCRPARDVPQLDAALLRPRSPASARRG